MREKFLYWLAGIFQIAIMAVPVKVETMHQKFHDCSKFTRHDFDVINSEYALHTLNNTMNEGRKATLDSLVEKLNSILGYDKRRTAYSKIWNGDVERASLGEI